MIFTPLASSSKGNAYLVTDGETTILLECGLTLKELQKRMGFTVSQIDACFVSHEHKDHSKAAGMLLKRGIPVYMSYGTAVAHTEPMDEANIMKAKDVVQIGKLRVMALNTYHNVKEPLGFLIDHVETQERLLFAIDTVNLNYIIPRLTQIAIECNYSKEIMDRLTKMDETRKRRVIRSHMEIETAVTYLRKLDLSKCTTIWLMHLSASCSNEYQFRNVFRAEFPGIEIKICEE